MGRPGPSVTPGSRSTWSLPCSPPSPSPRRCRPAPARSFRSGGHRARGPGGGARGEGLDAGAGRRVSNPAWPGRSAEANRGPRDGEGRRRDVHQRLDRAGIRPGAAGRSEGGAAVVCIGPVTAPRRARKAGIEVARRGATRIQSTGWWRPWSASWRPRPRRPERRRGRAIAVPFPHPTTTTAAPDRRPPRPGAGDGPPPAAPRSRRCSSRRVSTSRSPILRCRDSSSTRWSRSGRRPGHRRAGRAGVRAVRRSRAKDAGARRRGTPTGSPSGRCGRSGTSSATTHVVIADLCLDEYTDHGHCGVLDDDGSVDNDATLELLPADRRGPGRGRSRPGGALAA